jgi:hypothetical protein
MIRLRGMRLISDLVDRVVEAMSATELDCTHRLSDRLGELLNALKILAPETVLRWHRAGSRAYGRGKPRSCVGGVTSANRSCARP